MVYIGQTRRKLEVRLKEHLAAGRRLASKRKLHENSTLKIDKCRSSVGKHILETGHQIGLEDISLVRNINSRSFKFDVAESLEIYKQATSSLLNEDKGDGFSKLFQFADRNHKSQNIGTGRSVQPPQVEHRKKKQTSIVRYLRYKS